MIGQVQAVHTEILLQSPGQSTQIVAHAEQAVQKDDIGAPAPGRRMYLQTHRAL